MTFNKEQIALFISVALHFITGVFSLFSLFALPKVTIILITVLWVIIDLALVYRVASMSGKKVE